jgi:hypothetical protein
LALLPLHFGLAVVVMRAGRPGFEEDVEVVKIY